MIMRTIITGHHKYKQKERTKNRLIFQYFPGLLTKFQYIQGLQL